MKKSRLDIVLSNTNLSQENSEVYGISESSDRLISRTRAASLIIEGKVAVNGKICTKPGTLIDINSAIKITEETNPYVSRGGLKLKGALNDFIIDVKNKKALDIGASTGGFTDCLIKEGADFVYCVDVGYGQLDYCLRNHSKIKNIERTNIKDLLFEKIGEKIDICVIDASFISLKKVLPHALKFLKDDGKIIALIKPQFETENKNLLKKGVIKNEDAYDDIIKGIAEFSKTLNLNTVGVKKSCIKGKKGNTEFFIVFSKNHIN